MPFLSPLSLAIILLTWMVARRTASATGRQAIFLGVSVLFYASAGGWFLGILALSALWNYYWGGVLRRNPSTPLLWAGVAANVGLLSLFKYLPQMVQPWVGYSAILGQLAVLALPLGISFWTFQGLSYLFDQYRGEDLDPTLLEFCVYIAFAPTVLSGPICRVADLLPQLRSSDRPAAADLVRGVQQMWIGVFMILVGRLLGSGVPSQGVSWAFTQAGNGLGFADTWILLAGYGFQIFFDFAGYSRLVIGLAAAFGITLPENFDRPFLATTPTTFWQRWHMSLSFWIRDYLFMPMAMLRGDLWWRNLVLVISMAVFGLWHQASWLFLLWGLYQGSLLVLHRQWQQFAKRTKRVVPDAVSWLVTYAAITLSWILFRSEDLRQAGALFSSALWPLASGSTHLPASFTVLVLGVAAVYFGWCRLSRREEWRTSFDWVPVEARFAFYALTFYLLVYYRSTVDSFIYLRF